MSDLSSISLGYTNIQGLLFKAHARPLTQKDLHPLASFMQSRNIHSEFEAMMAKLVWRAPGGKAFEGPKHQPNHNYTEEFIELKTKEEIADALATSKDRMRLYATQGYPLLWLMFRLTSWHLLVGFLLGVGRSCALILQVWSLWTIVRIANEDPDYNYGK
eukprot:PhF_6_TR25964/c0_g2_i1/m.36625